MSSENEEILRKLDEIQARLDNLESNSQVISEERTEIAGKGELENEIIENRNETVVTRKRVPVCDSCGRELKAFSVCQKCNAKICDKCSIDFRNQVICKKELQSIYPLSKPAFKVMLLIANKITNEDHIRNLSGIPKSDLKELLSYLKGAGYIEISAFFTRKQLTDMGHEALHSYAQIVGGIGDMAELDKEIARYVLSGV